MGKRKWIGLLAVSLAAAAAGTALLLRLFLPGPDDGVRIRAVFADRSETLFDSGATGCPEVSAKKGESFDLVMENGTKEAVTLTLLLDSRSLSLTRQDPGGPQPQENGLRITLSPGASQTAACAAQDGAALNDGVLLERSGEYTAYAGTAETLRGLAADAAHPGGRLTLLRPVTVPGGLTVGRPCRLAPGGHDLTIEGELWLRTGEPGEFLVEEGKGRLRAAAFYAQAAQCAVVMDEDRFDFEQRPGYYMTVASFNGRPVDKEKAVRTAAELRRLLDPERLPLLTAGDDVVLEQGMSLEEGAVIPLPVTLRLRGKLDTGEPLRIETRREGVIAIRVEEGGSLSPEALQVEAPACALLWEGGGAPEEREVAERHNVLSYNGKPLLSYGLGGAGEGRVTSFALKKAANPAAGEDVQWSIEGNRITVSVSYLVGDAALRSASLEINTQGGTASFSPDAAVAGGKVNLLGERRCTVTDVNGATRVYVVRTNRVALSLPVVDIRTADGKAVTSPDDYKSATVAIAPGQSSYPALKETAVSIRGRGHSTWEWPKKPYKLKFAEKTAVLGLHKAKQWVLLANYSDKTLLRNHVAMEMGKALEHLSYTPSQIPVDVFVNGVYQGVYTMGEQLEVKTGRIELQEDPGQPDTGYLLEVGGSEKGDKLGKVFFHAGELRFVAVKHPDDEELTAAQFAYIQRFCQQANDAVVSLGDYEAYIDVDSLVDWFLLHEWSYNLDSSFRRSCYLTKEKGGKLKMGPAWDFDLAFGNFSKDEGRYDTWACLGSKDGYVKVNWMNHLLEDPRFMTRLKARWKEIKTPLMNQAMVAVDEAAAVIGPSQALNFQVWKLWNVRAGYQPASLVKYNTYDKQIGYLKAFIEKRAAWIDSQLS